MANFKKMFLKVVRGRNFAAAVLMAPFLIIFTVFTVWPVIFSFLLSFTSFNVFEPPKLIWFDNYINLFFADDVFQIAIANTFKYAVIVGPVSYLLCLFFAWIINELGPTLRAVLTVIFYAPSISGSAFIIWLIVFDGDVYGYLNSFLIRIGLMNEPSLWLRDPRYMLTIVIIVQLWLSLGTSFLAMRAGFNTVDVQYYEAAAVDGIRNRWQELWYVTLPIMSPHLMLSAVLAITGAFGSAHVASVMTGFPSTNYATHMIMHHLIDYGTIRFERGYAAAIATILFVMSIVLNRFAQKLIGRIGK